MTSTGQVSLDERGRMIVEGVLGVLAIERNGALTMVPHFLGDQA
jgi:hypothetical protein